MDLIAALIHGFAWFSIFYFAVLNTWYLCLILLGGLGAVGASRRLPFADYDRIFASPLALPVSVVVPARNEERWIVDCVQGLLGLRYPEFEVIVVDDGSTDATFECLRREFGLVEHPMVIPADIPLLGAVHSVNVPQGRENLLVVRKDSLGHPADAVNAGINLARHPLVCRVDADSYLDANALLAVAKPFIENPAHIVAVSAAIRAANGSTIDAGRVLTPAMPGGWAAPIQAVEYIRAFLMGRMGWAQLRGMLFIPGVFGVFRRDLLVDVGGMDTSTDGDDVELLIRIHHRLRRDSRMYEIPFVPEPCCWTQVPRTYRSVARQRRRWANILSQSLWLHRSMLGNPRYGIIGLVALPYFLVFELASPAVEVLALATLAAGIPLGIVSPALALLFVVAALGFTTLLTVFSMLIETFWFHRYRTVRDFLLAIYAAVAENVGFRQAQAWWRLRGIADFCLGRSVVWGKASASPGVRRPPASGTSR